MVGKLYNYVATNGKVFKARDVFSESFRNRTRAAGCDIYFSTRVGWFEVVLYKTPEGSDGLLATCRYECHIIDDPNQTLERDAPSWQSYKKQRSSHLDKVEKALAGHPLEKNLIQDIIIERKHLM